MNSLLTRSARWLGAIAVAIGISAQAVPMQYSWDDTAIPGGGAGVGVFTLDLPSTTGETSGTAVAGGGVFLGSWHGVAFRVTPSFTPSLTISNLTGSLVTFSRPGDVAGPASSSIDEWQTFVTYWRNEGVKVELLTPVSPVPDSGPVMPVTLAALAGLCAYASHRRRQDERRAEGSQAAERRWSERARPNEL